IPDPANLESEATLLARARVLHPDEAFPDDAPSRFRKDGAAAPAEAGATAPAVASAAAKPAAAAANGAAKSAAAPAPTAPKPAPAAPAPAAAAPASAAALPADANPNSWEVPIICKDCHQRYTVPFRLFQAGVVFYCPSCSGSFVPNSVLYRTVKETFENFYDRRRAEREAFERRRAREAAAFEARQAAEMDAFNEGLEDLANRMKPAGKLVRPKGLAAMFT
ncbi:MAG TPA: hypothetical protein VIX59_20990, partial [Candidatus Binataceae bacterium]